VDASGGRSLRWTDVTARLGPVVWPKLITHSFSRRDQLVRFLAKTVPQRPPRAPRLDFAHHRLILVAAGPRSSTGYAVRIVRIRERRDGVHVLARELTPSLGDRVVPRLTSPYRLVEIPATRKRVYVSWQGRP
jgi:hypothetical protein